MIALSQQIKWILFALLLSMLTACGGGGSGKSDKATAIAAIAAFAKSGGELPTLETYSDAGIIGVTAANLSVVNAFILTKTEEDVDTAPEIQAIIDTNFPAADIIKPTITLIGDSLISITVGNSYSDAGAQADDNLDGNITSKITINNPVDTSQIGIYLVTYNVKDIANNEALEVIRTVKVTAINPPTTADTTKPVITLLGIPKVNLILGDSYSDAGAEAIDNRDGNITSLITIVNPVNTSEAGTYTVTYNVDDTAGNHAAQVTREVNVKVIKPKIFIIGDSTVHHHTSSYLLNTRQMTCGADNPTNEIQGWGDALNIYATTPSDIINKARAGSSSVTFRTEETYDADIYGVNRDWGSTKTAMESAGGGILLIQFGSSNENNHAPEADYDSDGDIDANDETQRIALRKSNFDEAIGNYITEARALNITPVLVTPPDGRLDSNGTTANGTHPLTRGAFPGYIRSLGITHSVEVIDLNNKSNTEFAKYSDETLLREFGDCSYGGISIDRVHYEPQGASKVAGWIKELACNDLVDISLCTKLTTEADKLIPTISLVGSYQMSLASGEVFNEPGASAFDDTDGNISANIVAVNNIDTNIAGNYSVTYDVKDSSNNKAIQIVRTVSVGSGVIIHEDAGDGDIDEWELYGTTLGSSITNVFDAGKNSRVIELSGNNGIDNGFRFSRNDPWDETANFVTSWSMKFSEDFTVFISVDTQDGFKVFEYQPIANLGEITGTGRYRFGLGEDAKNGVWQTFKRDLAADLNALDPDNALIRIHRIAVKGSGRIDDIKTMRTVNSIGNTVPPVVLLTGNSTLEILKDSVYNDAGATASDDEDGDITANIITTSNVDSSTLGTYSVIYKVHDSAGHGAFVTRTVEVVDVIDETITVLDDAEDEDTIGWGTYAGSGTIENIADNGGRVIELSGPNGLGDGFQFTNLNITNGFVASWSMKYSEAFEFMVKVKTVNFGASNVYLKYTPHNISTGYSTSGSNHYIHNGLGDGVTNDTWRSFSRDVKADFNVVFPNDTIQEIIGFYIRGSGRIDNLGISTRGATGTFNYGGHNYEIVKSAISWQEASNTSNSKGGNLVNIGSIAENHEIYSRLYRFIDTSEHANTVATNGGGASYVWIGANDIATEETWRWDDNLEQFWTGGVEGSSVGGLYNNWGRDIDEEQHEPDNASNQDAAGMALTQWPINSGGLGQASQWNDLIAADELFYIIEY